MKPVLRQKILVFIGKVLLAIGTFLYAFYNPTVAPVIMLMLAYTQFSTTEKYQKASDEEIMKYRRIIIAPVLIIGIIMMISVNFFFKEYG